MSTPEEPRAEELRRALREQGRAHLQVRGGSMRPTILSGELIRIVPTSGVARGDVVTFLLDDAVVTHRVVAVAGAQIVCRGDDRSFADPPVSPEAILGRAVEVVGRRSLAGGWRALALVNARRAVLGAPMKVRRLLEESGLLLRQACRRRPAAMEPTAGGIPELSLDEGWRVLQPEDLLPGGEIGRSEHDESAMVPVVVPAGVFSALAAPERRRVLVTLRGRPALVCGLPLEAAGRLVRVLGRVRRMLRRVGLRAGEPGDGVVHAVAEAPRGLAHYFSAAALAGEMERAGVEVEKVELRGSEWGPIVCARTVTAISISDNTS